MCTSVSIGHEYFETVGELRAKLGALVLHDESWEPESPECCLCGVDVRASANAAGYCARKNPFGYTLYKRQPRAKHPDTKLTAGDIVSLDPMVFALVHIQAGR